MGERLKGYLTEFQKNQGYYLEEADQSIALYKFTMGETNDEGEKVTGGAYNPVPIAIVSKDADPDKERLIKKLIMSVQR